MTKVEMYAATWCPYCIRAKSLLDKKQVEYEFIDVDKTPDARREMMQRGGGQTIPQIFVNGRHIGGSDDLLALEERGELDGLLESDQAA